MKKPFMIIAAILVVAAAAFGVYYIGNPMKFYTPPKEVTDQQEAAKAAESARRPQEIYAGDDGELRKGKLLDQSAKAAYDALPDVLAHASFGDAFFCVNCDSVTGYVPEIQQAATAASDENMEAIAVAEPEHTYSLFEEKQNAQEVEAARKDNDYKWEKLLDYLKLAEEGKAEFPQIGNASGSDPGTMRTPYAYKDMYRDLFTTGYTQEIPTAIKNKMMDFFSSSDGQGYAFITDDQRDHAALIRTGDFTGSGKKDQIACIVGTKSDYQGTHREKLLMYAYNAQGIAYLLYSEDFYDKVLLDTIYPDPEGRWDNTAYMDSEEKIELPFEAVRVKEQNKPDTVYVYNKEFDKMQRFAQKPKSQTESKANTEEEDDE